jgi:uncharacterized membrane protein YagU involved in acid resistance
MNWPTIHGGAFNTIVWGGLLAGTLDATDSVIAYGILGMNPVQVLQYVASGLLGSAAFAGITVAGLANAALGAVLHYFIACVVASVYYAAAMNIALLNRKPLRYGLLFGAAVYLFMNYLVLPHSAVAKTPFSWGLFLNGIIGHAIFIGVPIALLAAVPRGAAATPAGTRRPVAA